MIFTPFFEPGKMKVCSKGNYLPCANLIKITDMKDFFITKSLFSLYGSKFGTNPFVYKCGRVRILN